MFDTFKEVELFFKNRRKIGIKPGLDRVHFLLDKVNHPEKDSTLIHVAGTNGKGSTIQFIKNVLVASGYRVGVFSSPSFTGLCGYFTINHQEISEVDFLNAVNYLYPFIQELDEKNMHPTEFEIITVMAFLFF